MPNLSDGQLRHKGLKILFHELGEVDTVRFLSQIRHEQRNYRSLQETLCQEITLDEIYENAKTYSQKKYGRFLSARST
jgi:hypothetical protein